MESTQSNGNSNWISFFSILSDVEHVVLVFIFTFVVIGDVFTGAVIVSVFLCLGLLDFEADVFELDNLPSPQIGSKCLS